jgi:hypothetical protein
MSTDTFLAMKRVWDEQQKKEDRGEETFKKDAKLPTRNFDGGPTTVWTSCTKSGTGTGTMVVLCKQYLMNVSLRSTEIHKR